MDRSESEYESDTLVAPYWYIFALLYRDFLYIFYFKFIDFICFCVYGWTFVVIPTIYHRHSGCLCFTSIYIFSLFLFKIFISVQFVLFWHILQLICNVVDANVGLNTALLLCSVVYCVHIRSTQLKIQIHRGRIWFRVRIINLLAVLSNFRIQYTVFVSKGNKYYLFWMMVRDGMLVFYRRCLEIIVNVGNCDWLWKTTVCCSNL